MPQPRGEGQVSQQRSVAHIRDSCNTYEPCFFTRHWLLGFTLIAVTLLLSACRSQSTAQAPRAPTDIPTATVMAMPTATPTVIPQSYTEALHDFMPVRLVIPKLHVSAPIIPVGTDSHGAMLAPTDAPKDDPLWDEVYWWQAGALPGQVGNAVIAGHVNRPIPGPAPFSYITQLAPGDTIQVDVADGKVFTFSVQAVTTPSAYETGTTNPVLQAIFGPSLTPNLNLITCYGRYDGHTFDHRLVVWSTLVGSSPFPTPPGIVNPNG